MNFEKFREHLQVQKLADQQLDTVPQLLQELARACNEGGPTAVTHIVRKRLAQLTAIFEKCLQDVKKEAGIS